MREETENAQSIVDGNEHHILGSPFLSVELRFRTPSFAITATMNPQGNREFLTHLSWCFCPNIQVEAVFTVRRFLSIAPFRGISTWVVNRLVARVSKLIGNHDAFPRHNWLWSLPTQLTDRRCCIRNASIDIHSFDVCFHALHLSSFDAEDWIL